MRHPACQVLNAYHPQGFVHPVVDGFGIEPEIRRTKGNVLLNGRGEDLVVRVLEDDTDKFPDLPTVLLCYGFASDKHGTGCRFKNTIEVLEQRTLSRTIRSDHRDTGISRGYEIDIV